MICFTSAAATAFHAIEGLAGVHEPPLLISRMCDFVNPFVHSFGPPFVASTIHPQVSVLASPDSYPSVILVFFVEEPRGVLRSDAWFLEASVLYQPELQQRIL